MKILEAITGWTRRNLRWMIPFVVITPFALWWWNANIDAIGHWIWLALHGQKGAQVELGLMVALVVGLLVFLFCEGRANRRDAK